MSEYIANGLLQVGATYIFRNYGDRSRALNVWSSNSYPATQLSNVCLWQFDTTDAAQMWKLVKNSAGNYMLQSKVNKQMCLDLYTGSANGSGANAHLYTPGNTSFLKIEEGSHSGTVTIKLQYRDNMYLTANTGSNGTMSGRTTSSPGNAYFTERTAGMPSQEWIPVELECSYLDIEKQYLIPPYPVSGVTADYDEDCDMIAAAKTAGTKVCSQYYYTIHWGVDFAGRNSSTDTSVLVDIKASGYGVVESIGNATYLGNTLLIKYPNAAYGNGTSKKDVYFLYCHLASINVAVGDIVTPSTDICVAGMTGEGADARHLHLEAYEQLITKSQSRGGTIASVDPTNYLFNSSANNRFGLRTLVPDSAAPFYRSDRCNGGVTIDSFTCTHTNTLYFYDSDKIYARGNYQEPDLS